MADPNEQFRSWLDFMLQQRPVRGHGWCERVQRHGGDPGLQALGQPIKIKPEQDVCECCAISVSNEYTRS